MGFFLVNLLQSAAGEHIILWFDARILRLGKIEVRHAFVYDCVQKIRVFILECATGLIRSYVVHDWT